MSSYFLLAAISLGATLASATVIDFNNFDGNIGARTTYSAQGFTFTSAHFHINDVPASCGFGGCASIDGTPLLAVDAPLFGFPVTMMRDAGGPFDLIGLQATRVFVDGTASAVNGFYPNAESLILTGILQGGGIVTYSVSLPALPGFAAFTLPGSFRDLISLTFSGSVPGLTDNASFAVDNIEVAFIVPEPSTMLLIGSGLALLLGIRQRGQ